MNKRLFITILAFVAISMTAIAQPKPTAAQRKEHKRVEAERIAFITKELDLSPEEAEAFWPVYNYAQKQDREGFHETRTKFDALREGVESGKSDAEIQALIDEFVRAKEEHKPGMEAYAEDFIKVIGVEKTAKLFIAEDDFRARQIKKLSKK